MEGLTALRSMTGFGRCYVENPSMTQQWEIKSVNSRYLDLKWRLPPFVRYLEPALEKIARRRASRGRIEISLALHFSENASLDASFDSQQARAMLMALERMALERGDAFAPDYTRLLSVSSLWGEPQFDDIENLSGMIEEGFIMALEDWDESRLTEGAMLAKDLEGRFALMGDWRASIADAAPALKEDKIQALRKRLTSALAIADCELEEERFLQEVVVLADRLDVSEELTRLGTHLERMRQLLRAGRDAGRKLDFTLQECFREINTCGNKLQDAELSGIVVDFKNELEKCREQAQNLE